jgi:hypothetical protein
MVEYIVVYVLAVVIYMLNEHHQVFQLEEHCCITNVVTTTIDFGSM